MRINSIQNNSFVQNKKPINFGKDNRPKKFSEDDIELANDAATCSVLLSVPFLMNSKADKKFTAKKATGYGLLALGVAAYATSIVQRIKLYKAEKPDKTKNLDIME